VQSSDVEEGTTKELDLVSMANALLRMGDAALIINEVRSRVAVQGIINLLNTQPGVFLLYNLHAESLRDIQDRLELVFGMPAASMYATDRYTFLKKIKFGRRGRVYRVLGFEYESDMEEKKFVEIFRFRRGETIDACTWEAKFVRNPEASAWDFSKVDLKKLSKDLDLSFVPPALAKRSEETGISPEQYVMQAFWKGKMYHNIYRTSQQLDDKLLLELDFVVKVNTAASRLLVSMEKEQGEIDFGDAWVKWEPIFKEVLKTELEKRKLGGPVEILDVPAPAAAGLGRTVGGKEAPLPPSKAADEEGPEEGEEGAEAEEEALEAPRPTPKKEAAPAAPAGKSLLERLREKKKESEKKGKK
jgi:hypothetical protein